MTIFSYKILETVSNNATYYEDKNGNQVPFFEIPPPESELFVAKVTKNSYEILLKGNEIHNEQSNDSLFIPLKNDNVAKAWDITIGLIERFAVENTVKAAEPRFGLAVLKPTPQEISDPVDMEINRTIVIYCNKSQDNYFRARFLADLEVALLDGGVTPGLGKVGIPGIGSSQFFMDLGPNGEESNPISDLFDHYINPLKENYLEREILKIFPHLAQSTNLDPSFS